jgi:hypothetical protein
MIGFAVTLAALILYALFTGRQVASLRKLQANTVERNRLDTLQLMRIQDSLYSLGLALHDVVEDQYGLIGFEPEFKRLRMQLADAVRKEAALAPYPEQDADQAQLATALRNLDKATEQVFALAKAGDEKQARDLIVGTLRPQRESLSQRISRMLIQNNELDQQTTGEIEHIYTGVDRDIYTFLLAALAAIIVTALSVAYTNRRMFEQIAA